MIALGTHHALPIRLPSGFRGTVASMRLDMDLHETAQIYCSLDAKYKTCCATVSGCREQTSATTVLEDNDTLDNTYEYHSLGLRKGIYRHCWSFFQRNVRHAQFANGCRWGYQKRLLVVYPLTSRRFVV